MTLIAGEGLSLNLGGQRILDQVDIRLEPGEMLGLIGPNGAGKSSLLKLLTGLHHAERGTLRITGRAGSDLTREQRSRRIAWLGQQREVHWPLSVETLIELGRAPHLGPWEQPSAEDREIIERVIEQTDLRSLRRRPFNTLSGGEQARVLLARALATEPQILLADEPIAALDIAHQLDMLTLLSRYCREGRGVILVLHDLPLAAHFCDRLQLLHQGRTLAVGSAGAVLSAQHLKTAYQVIPTSAYTSETFAIPWQRINHPG
ncbi:MAG: ABC transporter ATP-binding protein [Gammaproteobacteria bacterium]|nr:ABC transporter ATP-binding protein [Gammaproteobacteria bacterium]